MSLFRKISKFVKGDADIPYNNWSQQLPSLTFTQLSSYGMAAAPSVVAYEPLQQLLAVGTRKTTGIVRLFARNGQTVDLIPKDTRTATVQFLAFQPGRPVLVSVDSQNTITLFNLITRLPTFTHTARMTVTCIELLPSTDWLLVGYADASVDVYDIARGWRSPYVITDQHMRTTGISLPRGIPAVVGIVAHPFKLGKILIGYSTGLIILWDFTTRKQVLAIRPLSVPTPTSGTDTNRGSYEPQLTAIACHPDGSQVVAGYEDGNLAFWDLENEKERPLLVRRVQSTEDTGISKDAASPSVHTAVYKLTWCAYSSGQPNSTRLIIGGGADITTPQPAVHILDLSKSSSQSTKCVEFHPPILSHDETPTTVNNSSQVPCSASTVDFFVHAQSSPWRPICDPAEIIIVQEPCTLRRFSLPPWAPPSKASQIPSSWFNELQVPGDLQLVNSNISFSLLVTGVTGSTYSCLARNLDEINSEKMEELHLGPLKPEQITSSPSKNRPGVTADRDLFLTVHAPENTLRIWNAGTTGQGTGLSRCIAEHKLDPSIGESVVSPSLKIDGTPGVTAMKFVEMSGEEPYLAVGFSDGRVVVWNIGRRTSTKVQKNGTIQVTALMSDETLEKKTPPAESTLAEPTSENDAKSNEITTEANDVSAVANKNEDMIKSNEILAQSVKGLTLKTISSNASTTGAIVQRILVSGFRGCIRSLEVGGSGSLLAISDDHGMAAVVDVSSGVILMAEDINDQVDNSKSSASAGSLNCVARDTERNSVDTVTSMKFADAAVGESDNVKHRLLIGTQHGCVQMYTCMKSCDKPEEKGDGTQTWTIVPDSSFRLHEPTSIIMMTVFDASGLEETPTATSDKDGAPQITGDLAKTSPSSPSVIKNLPPLPDVTPAPVPATSPLEAPIKSSSKSSLPHLLLIVTSRAARIHSRCTSTRLHKAGAPKRKKGEGSSNVHFVGAAVVRQNGIPFLLCLTDESMGVVFSLPHLEIIQEIELNGVNAIGLREAQILEDGRISVIAAPSEFKQLKLVSESEASQLRQRGFYDDSVTCPARPKEKGGGILGFFGIGSGSAEPSSDDLDELLGGAARPKPRPPLAAASKPSGAAAVAASTNAFSQAKQGLDERGERLGILADKMEGMEQSSADFLSSVREYNARQAKKKWYEL